MRTMILPALAALALAGCGGIAPEAERNVTTVNSDEAVNATAEGNVIGNEAETGNALATVLTLNDVQRNGVFKRALDDAGITCDGVASSDRLPDQDGLPLWRANCRGLAGTSHMISITPDGMAHIVSRSDR